MSHLKRSPKNTPISIIGLTATNLEDAIIELLASINAGGGGGTADGVINNIVVSGDLVTYTGINGGFSGSIDMSTLTSVVANSAKVGITAAQAAAIIENTLKNANSNKHDTIVETADFAFTAAHQEVLSGPLVGAKVLTDVNAGDVTATLNNLSADKTESYMGSVKSDSASLTISLGSATKIDGLWNTSGTAASVVIGPKGSYSIEETEVDGEYWIICSNCSEPDSSAPTVPTNLINTTQSDTTLTYTWSPATDNVGVTTYKVTIDGGTPIDVGNVTTYTFTGLNSTTTYNVQVSACDAAGNDSGTTAVVPGTTTVPNSYTETDVLSLPETLSLGNWSSSLPIAVSTTEFDTGVGSLAVTQSAAGTFLSVNNASLVLLASTNYTFTIKVKAPVGTTNVGFRVRQNAGAGNVTLGSDYINGDGNWQMLSVTFTTLATTNPLIIQLQPSSTDDNFANMGAAWTANYDTAIIL